MPLKVTLGTQVQGDGSTAAWNASGDPVLTPSSTPADAGTTGAYATLTPASNEVPATEPTFTTDHYTAGSPRWFIQLSNGHSLWGYPPNSGLNGSDFAWAVDNGNSYTSYSDAVKAAEAGTTGTTVKSVQIVADGDQPGVVDTITNVSYDGQVLGAGTVTLATEPTQHAVKGHPYSLNDAAAVTSSDPNLTYVAYGLPAGVTIGNDGMISGTPTESGQFAVSITATDAYGDHGYQRYVMDVSSGVTYTTMLSARGEIKNVHSGKCLDVRNGNFAAGGVLQQWSCGAAGGANQQFQIVTIKGSDGSMRGYLEAIAPSGQVFYVSSTPGAANAQLDLSTARGAADDMLKSGSYYTFPQTGLVSDVKGASTANGAEVIGYAKDGGTNQQWSMP